MNKIQACISATLLTMGAGLSSVSYAHRDSNPVYAAEIHTGTQLVRVEVRNGQRKLVSLPTAYSAARYSGNDNNLNDGHNEDDTAQIAILVKPNWGGYEHGPHGAHGKSFYKTFGDAHIPFDYSVFTLYTGSEKTFDHRECMNRYEPEYSAQAWELDGQANVLAAVAADVVKLGTGSTAVNTTITWIGRYLPHLDPDDPVQVVVVRNNADPGWPDTSGKPVIKIFLEDQAGIYPVVGGKCFVPAQSVQPPPPEDPDETIWRPFPPLPPPFDPPSFDEVEIYHGQVLTVDPGDGDAPREIHSVKNGSWLSPGGSWSGSVFIPLELSELYPDGLEGPDVAASDDPTWQDTDHATIPEFERQTMEYNGEWLKIEVGMDSTHPYGRNSCMIGDFYDRNAAGILEFQSRIDEHQQYLDNTDLDKLSDAEWKDAALFIPNASVAQQAVFLPAVEMAMHLYYEALILPAWTTKEHAASLTMATDTALQDFHRAQEAINGGGTDGLVEAVGIYKDIATQLNTLLHPTYQKVTSDLCGVEMERLAVLEEQELQHNGQQIESENASSESSEEYK